MVESADHPAEKDWSSLSEGHLRQVLEGKGDRPGGGERPSAFADFDSGPGSVMDPCTEIPLSELFESSRLDTCERLQSLSGVGPSLAMRLLAAHEVGRRSHVATWNRKEPFRSSRQVHDHLAHRWVGESREYFCLLLLDVRHRLIRDCVISIGSLTASIVHPREVFRPAVTSSAAAVILAHNHPSGDPDPSAEDLRVTHRLYRCGQWLGIPVLDHVICGIGNWCSLRESSLGPWSPSGGEESHHADETGVDGTL